MALSVNDELKLRMLNLKPHLPKNWFTRVMKEHPEMKPQAKKMKNVVYLQIADEKTIEFLENFFKKNPDHKAGVQNTNDV